MASFYVKYAFRCAIGLTIMCVLWSGVLCLMMALSTGDGSAGHLNMRAYSIAATVLNMLSWLTGMWAVFTIEDWWIYSAEQEKRDKDERYKKWLEQVDVEYHLRTALSELKRAEGAVDNMVVREHFDEAQKIAKRYGVELTRDAEGGVYARLQT